MTARTLQETAHHRTPRPPTVQPAQIHPEEHLPDILRTDPGGNRR